MAILREMRPFNVWIVCEHLPATQDFTPNMDQRAGPDNRLGGNSGNLVTAPPFNVTPRREITFAKPHQKEASSEPWLISSDAPAANHKQRLSLSNKLEGFLSTTQRLALRRFVLLRFMK